MRFKFAATLLCAALAVSGCGGDDTDMWGNPRPQKNNPPVANAGADQTVVTGSRIILDGSRSKDPEGTRLTYSWAITQLPPKSAATLTEPTSMRPAVMLDVPGQYKFGLVVSDGLLVSDESVVTVTATGDNGNGNGNGNGTGAGGTDNGNGTGGTGTGGTLGPVATLSLSTTSFADGGEIPTKYGSTGVTGGQNISPAISVRGLPANTKNLAVVIDAKCNSAAPIGCVIWGVFNMPASLTNIQENDPLMQQTGAPPDMAWGYSATGSVGYWGPSGGGTGFSDYDVTIAVYALSEPIPKAKIDTTPYTRARFEATFKNYIIGRGTMGGHFTHPR